MRGIRRFLGPAAAIAIALTAMAGFTLAATEGPSAQWRFDETGGTVAVDAIGDLDGTIDGASFISDGVVGRAFRFDGSDRVTIPDSPILRGDNASVSLWVRADPEDPPEDGQVVFEKGDILCGPDGAGYAIVVDGRFVAVEYLDRNEHTLRNTLTVRQESALRSLWDGDWHHVTLYSNHREDGWGNVGIWIDGWGAASGPFGNSGAIDFSGTEDDPLVIGDEDDGCADGFVGDIDNVRAFDHPVQIVEVVADEPLVQSTLTLDPVEPFEVDDPSPLWVTVEPAPARPGFLKTYVTAEDGVERQVSALDLERENLDPNGHYNAGIRSDYGGEATFRVVYEPDTGPYLGSEASGEVTIQKRASQTTMGFQQTYIANEPIRLGVTADVDRPVQASGDVELYEQTPDGLVLLGRKPVEANDGTNENGAEFILPGRAAGTYQLVGRYLGAPSYLPSESIVYDLVIEPALVTGEVSINDGAEVTDDPVVSIKVPATGATGLWISTGIDDDRRFWTIPYTGEFETWLTAPWFGDDRDGVRTIWVRWADALGRWSATKTDTIILDRGLETGTVVINGGAATTTSNRVSLSVGVDDPSSVAAVEISNDGTSWQSFDYAATLPWDLADGEGLRTVRVRWIDDQNRSSMERTDTIRVDRYAPRLVNVIQVPAVGSVPGTTVPVRVTWSGIDGGGIARYEVQVRTNGGPWQASASTTATSMVRSHVPGRLYEYRARAFDFAGRASVWKAGAGRRTAAYQQTSSRVTFSGHWGSASSGTYWGGTTRYASTAGKTASFRSTGRGIAIVAPVGPSRGSARIYADGDYLGTVNLYAATNGQSRIVFEKRWTSTAARTITVKVVGTAGHGRVDIDGFITLLAP